MIKSPKLLNKCEASDYDFGGGIQAYSYGEK